MEKNWLIRTRAKQILGPVGKQKILEFVEKGSLAPDDEISSGNGYWFSIKEKDLLDKYVFGDLVQTFNPITEAPNVLTSNLNMESEVTGSLNPNTMPKEAPAKTNEDNIDQQEVEKLPVENDLDYPDMDMEAQLPDGDDLAFPDGDDLGYPDVGEVNTASVEPVVAAKVDIPEPTPPPMNMASVGHVEDQVPSTEEEGKLPDSSDLDYPDLEVSSDSADEDLDATDPSFTMPVEEETPPAITEEVSTPVKKKSKKKVKKTVKGKAKKNQRNDRYLFYVLIALVLLIFYAAYYYFTNVINSEASVIDRIFPKVYAQSLIEPMGKKKTF
ncbi:hypothetical protein [Halobacteriovorax sp. HLS]|uniref:hypothetical protein n=1 Tax=Halobacteriovorax sp. HLS TaxID=2234000 RepID=UPI000FDC11CF|nr:hypothetical protein [Halobacteriovorax sp. HLS]